MRRWDSQAVARSRVLVASTNIIWSCCLFGCGSSSNTAAGSGDATAGNDGSQAEATFDAVSYDARGEVTSDHEADIDGGAADALDAATVDVSALDSAADAGGVDGPIGDAAAVACGDSSCHAGQLCEYMTGGPAPPCSPLDDAGGCPAPLLYMASCPSLGGSPGCYMDTPPGAHGCVDIPPTCDAALSCQCLSPDPCGVSCPCYQVQDGSLFCGCP